MQLGNRLIGGAMAVAVVIGITTTTATPGFAGQYLVQGSGGPGFKSPRDALNLLQRMVIPTFAALEKLKAEKKLLAGGLPVGARAFVFILEASDNEEAGRIIRKLPLWPLLKWKVTPLQSFNGRAKQEGQTVKMLKKRMK
jgi:hypothetical protein